LIENKSNLANREVHGLSNYLDNNPHAPHSPEWEKYLTEGLRKFPNGANTPGGRKIYGDHYGEAPPTSEQMRNAIQFAQQTGQRIVSTQTTKSGRMDFRFQPNQVSADASTKPLVTELMKKHGLTPDQFSQLTNSRATNADMGSNMQTVESSRADAGKNVAFDLGGQAFMMPRQDFDKFSRVFRPNAAAAPAQQPNVTQDQYNSMKSGQTYFYNGKQYTKK